MAPALPLTFKQGMNEEYAAMAVLYPGDPAEALDLGRHAIALSRSTGLWSAVKIEREVLEVRYELARLYASENKLNHVTVDPPDAWIGIVSSGLTYCEVRKALARLGLSDDAAIANAGTRLLKMGMPLPFNALTMRRLARDVDETTCNLDFSCLEGDCPSFMTVKQTEPGRLARWFGRSETSTVGHVPSAASEPPTNPDPTLVVPADEFAMRITGIRGTGVVTVAQVLGTAAMLDGYHVRGLDQIGLSQKAGPAVSDVRLSRSTPNATNRLGSGRAHLLMAFDQLVAGSDKGMLIADPESTVVVGMAVQAGALPIDPARIEEAIGINGVAVPSSRTSGHSAGDELRSSSPSWLRPGCSSSPRTRTSTKSLGSWSIRMEPLLLAPSPAPTERWPGNCIRRCSERSGWTAKLPWAPGRPQVVARSRRLNGFAGPCSTRSAGPKSGEWSES